jgi:hypothetical protein
MDVCGQRRMGKRSLPPGDRYFGCRHCCELTYTSCQDRDKRVSFLRRNPQALLALLEDAGKGLPTSRLILGLQAARWR